jgi:hypothetical protein
VGYRQVFVPSRLRKIIRRGQGNDIATTLAQEENVMAAVTGEM